MTLHFGDTSPADDIYGNRFLERGDAAPANYVQQLLKTEKFEFTNDERVLVNRHKASYPRDLDGAQQIWRDRLRAEYLQELLNAEDPDRTNAPAVATAGRRRLLKRGLSATNAAPRTREQIGTDIVKTLSKRYERLVKAYQERDDGDVLE